MHSASSKISEVSSQPAEAPGSQSRSQPKFVWSVEMPPPPALLPRSGLECSLTVEADPGQKRRSNNSAARADPVVKKSLKFTFGDVWFCSGQSNMNMPLSRIEQSSHHINRGKFSPPTKCIRKVFFIVGCVSHFRSR